VLTPFIPHRGWAAALLLGCVAQATADVIYSPVVEQGETAIEWRSTLNAGGTSEHKLEWEFSPTAWWRTELLATATLAPESPRRWDEIAFENVFSLNPQGRDAIDFGVVTEIARSLHGDAAWAAELGVLAEVATAHTVTTLNISSERELTAGAPFGGVLAARWRWRRGARFEPGVEYHADVESVEHMGSVRTQRHSFGPSVLGRIRLGREVLRYEAAWLVGLTQGSPASTARLQLEWEFR
jgi:hypothetical protein